MNHLPGTRFLLLVTTLISAACGGDDDDGADPAADATASAIDAAGDDPIDAAAGAGSAEIDGQLHGRELTPTTAYLAAIQSVDTIVMPDGGADCALDEPDGTLTAIIGFPCGVPTAGSDVPVADATTCGDIANAWVLVEGFSGESPEYLAQSGTVMIATADADLVTGSFTAGFDGEDTLSGTFSAVVCGERDGSGVSR